MKNALVSIVIFGLGMVAMLGVIKLTSDQEPVALLTQPTPVPTPLTAYSFNSLRQKLPRAVPIVLGRKLSETPDVIRQLFTFTFAPSPNSSERKTVSGVLHLPKKPGNYPVILMMRGYIPKESFAEGSGTNPSATVFAQNGFITLAPDFLGFGESDPKADDEYESRFQTYTTALTLLSSIVNINSGLSASYSGTITADTTKVGIWGHSNGGHIALATLAISGTSDPTVLWAPVSKGFPYSVLAYTDEEDDGGKISRKSLANFETIYDADLFNPARYYDGIKAPIQLHQGTADEEVPYWWSDELVATLKKDGVAVDYRKYTGSEHNLRPAWNDVVRNSIEFYEKAFSK